VHLRLVAQLDKNDLKGDLVARLVKNDLVKGDLIARLVKNDLVKG
jgi:hypothetical protein